jgi:uncharacterized protein YdiU (UPF0061 family)
MFYDGHPKAEPGAIVCRVAPSFLRFGSFELFASRGDLSTLRALLRYCLKVSFPDITATPERPTSADIGEMFGRICKSTALMVAHWMRVGFVHGVMNTDNLSILGLTIDYGPYGWVEDYNPDFTPNTTDAQGRRYAFGKQPAIAEWNLGKLAEALVPLVDSRERLQPHLQAFQQHFETAYVRMLADKLGLIHLHWDSPDETGAEPPDRRLVFDLQRILRLAETDMTLFFRALAKVEVSRAALEEAPAERLSAPLEVAFYQTNRSPEHAEALDEGLRRYVARRLRDERDPKLCREVMNRTNPKFIPRNYLAQLAIDRAERGDGEGVSEWLNVLRNPYAEQPGFEAYAAKRPEWARHRPGCATLSCSS